MTCPSLLNPIFEARERESERETVSSRTSGRTIALGDDFEHEVARGDELASTRGAGVEFGGRIDELGDERLVRLEKLERVRRAASLVSIELHAVIAQNGEILLFVDGVGVERAIEDGSNALGGVGARNVAARAASRLADGAVEYSLLHRQRALAKRRREDFRQRQERREFLLGRASRVRGVHGVERVLAKRARQPLARAKRLHQPPGVLAVELERALDETDEG